MRNTKSKLIKMHEKRRIKNKDAWKNGKKIKGLIALSPLSFANCDFAPPLFFSDFAPHLLSILFCSKSSLKEGKGAKDWVQNRSKKKNRGCKIHNWQKDRG